MNTPAPAAPRDHAAACALAARILICAGHPASTFRTEPMRDGDIAVSHLRDGALISRDHPHGSAPHLDHYAYLLRSAGYRDLAIGSTHLYATPPPNTPNLTTPLAGYGLGLAPQDAHYPAAAQATADLTAAGHAPALLTGTTDDDGTETAHGCGFMVRHRTHGFVQVYHLNDGDDGGAVSGHRVVLRSYRSTLRDTGWQTDPHIFRCVHAWQAPTREGE